MLFYQVMPLLRIRLHSTKINIHFMKNKYNNSFVLYALYSTGSWQALPSSKYVTGPAKMDQVGT